MSLQELAAWEFLKEKFENAELWHGDYYIMISGTQSRGLCGAINAIRMNRQITDEVAKQMEYRIKDYYNANMRGNNPEPYFAHYIWPTSDLAGNQSRIDFCQLIISQLQDKGT
jgi:hypothetical protein